MSRRALDLIQSMNYPLLGAFSFYMGMEFGINGYERMKSAVRGVCPVGLPMSPRKPQAKHQHRIMSLFGQRQLLVFIPFQSQVRLNFNLQFPAVRKSQQSLYYQ
jgi:hypothetical protein